MDFDEDRSHIWLIYCENGDRKCVVTLNESKANWVRDVTPSESSVTANVLAISTDNNLYLVTGQDGIAPFTKLKVKKSSIRRFKTKILPASTRSVPPGIHFALLLLLLLLLLGGL
jgi:hypothetical protein